MDRGVLGPLYRAESPQEGSSLKASSRYQRRGFSAKYLRTILNFGPAVADLRPVMAKWCIAKIWSESSIECYLSRDGREGFRGRTAATSSITLTCGTEKSPPQG